MYQSQLDVIDLNDDLSGLQSAQFFIEQIEKRLEQLELEISIKHDFDDWAETARTFASDLGVSRSVDPKRNNCDGFWVEVRERHTGDVIALQVDRLVETDDFIRKWILTGRLFSGKTVNNKGLSEITEIRGYHGIHAQEQSEQIQAGSSDRTFCCWHDGPDSCQCMWCEPQDCGLLFPSSARDRPT